MERYNQIIRASLIDFEEVKFILANNNIKLVSSSEIRERFYLKHDVSLKNANYKTIIDESYIFAKVDEKSYLINKSESGNEKLISKIQIIDEDDCIDFLNHLGFKEAFTIEKNVYTYKNGNVSIEVINLIGIGLFFSVKKKNSNEEELVYILDSFNLPYDEKDNNIAFERLVLNKLRRYMK